MKSKVDKQQTGKAEMQPIEPVLSTRKQRQVLIVLGEDGWYSASVPSLPGCHSQGRTYEEALANIREAIDGFIEVLQDRGWPVPA
jgi:predicted RNase H-like HicB family nuclease